VLTRYRPWLGLATLLFVGWYVVFLFPLRILAAVSSAVALAQGSFPLAPAPGDQIPRLVVGAVIDLGLPLSVVALVVGFGVFHRQAETR